MLSLIYMVGFGPLLSRSIQKVVMVLKTLVLCGLDIGTLINQS